MRDAVWTELDRGISFLLAPVFLALGAISYFALRVEPSGTWLLFLVAVAAVGLTLARNRPMLRLLLAAAMLVTTGAALAKLETWRAGTKVLGGEISTRLTGRVVGLDHMASGRVRLTLDVVRTERPALRYQPRRVRASARAVPEGVEIGAVVGGVVRLMPPAGPVRPGSYDFSFESYFDGIGASGFFLGQPRLLAPVEAAPDWSTQVARFREAIADRIRTVIGGAEGEVAAALVVGTRAGIPEEVNEALRRTGLYHIISISGLHMALVAGTVMLGLRFGFALFPAFSARHAVKKYAAAAALVSLAAYLFISGAEVAAQRSFIMLAVMLAAVMFDRAALTIRNLAISALLVLAISPHEVVGPSFQMSFAATAALVGAYQAWSLRKPARAPPPRSALAKARRHVWNAAAGLAMTSVIAGLATAAFGAWHFQRVSPLSLLANLAVMPVVSLLVMPFSVLAAIAMPFGLDAPFLAVVGQGISFMLALAAWFSALSPVDAVGLIPAASVACITVALVIATLCTTWLRLAAVPFAIAGAASLGAAQIPEVLISEDARLVGVVLGDGTLAVNRQRPNAFTIEDWQRALAADEVAAPEALATDRTPSAPSQAGTRFQCGEGVCVAAGAAGRAVVHAVDAAHAAPACAYAALIVIEDASAKNPCRRRSVRVITARDLARGGSAAAVLSGPGRPSVEFAIDRPYRPWHAHRAFSRAARGLAPYKRASDRPAASPDAAASPATRSALPRERSDMPADPPAPAASAQTAPGASSAGSAPPASPGP